jgi:peptide/nickel transport system ATP-binding protein
MAGSGTGHLRPADQSLLRIEDLVVEFPVGRSGLKVHAVTGVSIDVLPGETLGLVGESGCGKSTMGKAVMQLVHAKSGSVKFEGNELTSLSGGMLRSIRPKLQMIFQDPISSLNPRRRVRDIVREGLDIWKIGDKASRVARVNEVLDTVGIDPEVAGPKRPHEFSGGQCQRISIARAVATEPKLIICDEPVSALDVSVQAQILNLLEEMKHKYGLTLIFIAHDLAVVKNVSDRVAVMYLGKLCEFAQPDELYRQPAHPYTAALLSAIPEPDPGAQTATRGGVGGEIPSPLSPPSGCRFRTRCPRAEDRCASEEPMMREVRPGHFVACHFPLGEITVDQSTSASATAPSPPSTPVTATEPEAAVGASAATASATTATSATSAMTAPTTVTTSAAVPDGPPPVAPVVQAPPPVRATPQLSVAPVTPPPAAPAPTRDDDWLVATVRAEPPAPHPVVDWAPEPPARATIAPPVEAAVDAPADAAEAVLPGAVLPGAVDTGAGDEPEATPDVASLDTLLPDRTKGGSVTPGR